VRPLGQRINIGVFLVWVVALGVALLRSQTVEPDSRARPGAQRNARHLPKKVASYLLSLLISQS
jgi:hypothetical protein